MLIKKIQYILIQLLFGTVIIFGQAYKAEFNKLTTPLFDKDPPVICIVEEGSSLLDSLSRYPEFTKKYTCYSTEALLGLKDQLNVKVLNPEDNSFLKAVKNKLAAGYILNWKTGSESTGTYLLEIFSTGTSSRIYTKKFFPSINSNPFEDAKKLLIDSMEVYYKSASGELSVTANPKSIRFKLMKGEKLALEWKGDLRQHTAAGTYKLVAEADNYITKEAEIKVLEGTVTSADIKLEPQFSKFIKVIPADFKITNIKTGISNNQVTIVYDLAGTAKSLFDVEMILENKKTGSQRNLQKISGDLEKIKPGLNKTIRWDMLQELGVLPSSEYEIKISARKAGGVPWYYYAGGAALLGGVTLLLGGGGGDDPGSVIKAGIPPGRP